jgi:two-component sensor histidine kinase
MERNMSEDAHAENARQGRHRDRSGPRGGATISGVDTTQSGPDHETVELLIDELNHRIRNLLAMVQALVRQTHSPTVVGYRDKLIARISCMSEAQELISSANGKPVPLGKLFEQTLSPGRAALEKRLHAAGPEVAVGPRLALALHLAFHELATNARKHGALSSPFGYVKIRWDLLSADGAARNLAILWSEHDGPQVNEPQRKGFGLSLIAGALTPDHAELSFEPTGVVCRMLVDLDHPPPEKEDENVSAR